ncbi:putative lipoprotein [Streptomyces himastatinicus ATCC 53653]|uniref:Putative lipoprotein n=1 Tax=Streptomyces himastatinicus ATCC 53653 TaxID=457427 RepID=D9WCI3_9ACTN|nr:DUF4232 domain-containing protein [Streptomyces himastatinicus]EFL20930.1 putative lipoprotein [Streptomyces himastatinicus ATCC 53653]
MAQRTDTTTPRPRRSRPWPLCALVLGALAVMTACGADTADQSAPPGASGASDSGDAAASSVTRSAAHTGRTVPPASHPASSGSASRPVTHSASASVSSSATAAHTTGSRPGARRVCSTEQLRLSLGRKDVGAGNVYMPLVLTNKSTGTCTLTGFPGVSLLDSAGSAIGDPATRRGASRSAVSLAPGASASAMLHTLNEGTSDTPCRRAPARIRAYPPDSFSSMTVPAGSFRVCGGVFEVESVHSGKGA